MSTIQRVTGTNSGLDVDALVKSAMQSYQSQIDKETQNEKVLEYQQQQYKQIMSDASDFYDKYFDVLKTGNLMSSSSYQTQTFTSTDGSKVSARGLAGATLDNYSVNVSQLASTASDTLLSSETGVKSITIGTSTITFNATSDGSATVANYNKAIADRKAALNAIVNPSDAQKQELSDLNNKVVTAKYSQFSGNVTFTASSFGGGGFTIKDTNDSTKNHAKAEDKYLEATVKNSKGEVYTISSADKKTSNSVTVDNVVFDFKGISNSTSVAASGTVVPVSALDEKSLTQTNLELTPLIDLTPLAEDGTTQKTTAADGTVTTVTTSGGKTTKTVTAPDKSTTVTTTQGAVTTVTNANGVTTTTDTSNLAADGKSGYTLQTIKSGSTTSTTTMINYDGTIPVAKTIQKVSGTTTTTTTLKSGDTTTVKQDVDDGTTTTTTSTTEKQGTDGSTTTVENSTKNDTTGVITVSSSTTTQLKVGTDGKTTKTVSTYTGIPALTALTASADLPDDVTTTPDVPTAGAKTTTQYASDGITKAKTTVTDADGTKTTTQYASDGITKAKTTVTDAGGTKTTTQYASDGTTPIETTVTESNGRKTTTQYASNGTIPTKTTVIGTDGIVTTTQYASDGTTVTGTSTTSTTAATYDTPTSLTGATDASALKDKNCRLC